MVDRRWLRVASLAETLTLFVLLLNRFTVHLDPITSLVGPLHGFAYLATIACGLLVPVRRSARALCWVPGIGGLLALRVSRPAPSAQPVA